MSTCETDNLFQMVMLLAKLQDTKCRNTVSPTEQLVVGPWVLATGDSFDSLMHTHMQGFEVED
jgi:hypothetical protein